MNWQEFLSSFLKSNRSSRAFYPDNSTVKDSVIAFVFGITLFLIIDQLLLHSGIVFAALPFLVVVLVVYVTARLLQYLRSTGVISSVIHMLTLLVLLATFSLITWLFLLK